MKHLVLIGLVLLILFCLATPGYAQQGQDWQLVQDNPIFFCQGMGVTGCNGGKFQGNMTPTVAGSVWVLEVQGGNSATSPPNNFTITSVTGGGGTWIHVPGAHVINNVNQGTNADAWYNLTGNAGENGTNLAFTLSGSAGTHIAVNFIELLPPAGSTASLDVVGTATPNGCSGSSATPCNAASVTTTATDVIIENPGGAGNGAWNGWSSPFITTANGSGIALNVPAGTYSPTSKYVCYSGSTATTCNGLAFFGIAFKSSLGIFAPPVSQYSIVQTALAMGPAQVSGSGLNCSAGCTVALPQATVAGNLLYVQGTSGSGGFMTAIACLPVACTSGSSTPVIPSGNSSSVCQRSYNGVPGISNAAFSCGWILSVPAGVTSVKVTDNQSNQTFTITIIEVHSTKGVWSLDAQGSTQLPNASYTLAGQALTLTGANDVVFQNFWAAGGNNAASWYPYLNLNWYCTGPGGNVGPCNALDYTNFNQAGIAILLDSGPTTPTPVWVNPQRTNDLASAAAFTATVPTVNLADCNAGTVTAAIAAIAVDQTVLQCPTGTYVWNANGGTTLANINFGYRLNGTTTVTGTCAPGGSCTPTDGTIIQLTTANHSNGSACDTQGNGGGCTNVTINLTVGKQVEISGIAWQSTTAFPGYGKIAINGNGSCLFRFDHNHINDNTSGDHFINIDNTCGVIDHNFFDSTSFVDTFFIQPTKNGSDGNANAAWTQPENFGSANFLFIENNQFQDGWFVDDCNYGAFMTLRFNIVGTNTSLQSHGVGSGAQRRGCRAMETYQNSFAFSTTPSGSCTGGGHGQAPGGCSVSTYAFAFLEDYETGTGMWWGNSVKGFQTFLRQQNVRSNNSTYPQTVTPNGWGFCGTNFNGTGSPWDSNSVAGTGYPCLDQIGYGAGDLLTGAFACPSCTPPTSATLTNSATGCLVGTFGSSCSGYPRQARVPTYAWSNIVTPLSPVPTGGNNYWQLLGGQSTESSDYYLERPNENNGATFTGVGGVGCGPSSSPSCTNQVARPATCTVGVAYWNVNEGTWNQSGGGGQGALDECTSTNTWTNAVYTPYTYPHPLTNGTVITGAPAVSISSAAFGNQLFRVTSNPLTVTVTNSGNAPLTLNTPYFTLTGANVSDFLNLGTGSCVNGMVLSPGNNCTVILSFRPITTTMESASLNISGNASASASVTGTGTAYPAGCGEYTDQTLCGDVGDPYEGNGPPPGQIPISACGVLPNTGPNFVLTQNVGSDPTINCISSSFPARAFNIDLGGFTVTGSVHLATNQHGDVVFNGTINCSRTGGTCLDDGFPTRFHHLTVTNNNTAPLANINVTGVTTVASPWVTRLDHITATVVACPNCNRVRNFMDDGKSQPDGVQQSIQEQVDHNFITIQDGASAAQGVELWIAGNSLVQNNYFVLPLTCNSCTDSPRAILFDATSYGDASFNTILVRGNRGIRVRDPGNNSQTINLHDNDLQQIGSPGRFAAIHIGENDTTLAAFNVNVYNNQLELASTGNGVVSAAATNVIVHDNTGTCYQNNCAGVGFIAETEVPSTLYAQTGTNIQVNNNTVNYLTNAGLPTLMVCGPPGTALYQCAANTTSTSAGTICASGIAVGNGSITLFNPPCPNIFAAPGASFNPLLLSFGPQPQNTTSGILTTTMTNIGQLNTSITSVTISGANSSFFSFTVPPSGSDCRTVGTVVPNGTCVIAVMFAPTLISVDSAQINVNDNVVGSPQVIPLAGFGTTDFGTPRGFAPLGFIGEPRINFNAR